MRIFFILISCVLSVTCLGQGLLLNGGFEEENICTEYKVNCAPEAWISNSSGFNNYFKDANRAHSGEHCMAVSAGHSKKPFERTFLRSQLLCRLKKGNVYRLSFFIKSPHAVLDSAGIYFGPYDPLLERKPVHRLSASVYLGDGHRFLQDSSWQQVSIDYTASGDEAYIMIASFARNDIKGSTGINLENQFFIFLDDISFLPVNPEEQLCSNWLSVKEDIYLQDERHEFLQRSIKYRRNQERLPLPLQPTHVFTVDTLLLPDVLFASGKTALEPSSYNVLDSFCRKMAGKTIDSLVIEGHADQTGSVQLNESLSSGRAGTVKDYLRGCTYFSRVLILTRGWGSDRPVADNATAAGRRQNRRVELRIYFRE